MTDEGAPRVVTRAATGRRRPASLRAGMWGLAVAITDLTPPGVRYGYVQPLARRLLQQPLGTLAAVEGAAFASSGHEATSRRTDLRCGLVADHLDVGGVGRVVEMLTEGLRSTGIEPVVVCPTDGSRTAHLRALGHEVVLAPDARSAHKALEGAHLDVVQLHSAPAHLVSAALGTGAPVVPVLHNTEIHYARPQWQATAELFERADAVIAVSEIVRRFHQARVPAASGEKIVVVPNGAMSIPTATADVRTRAREGLAALLGTSLTDDVVLVCLARYDSQKNIAGTVASFLDAIDGCDFPIRLVVAGDPSDWLEYRRADAIRRAHQHADRVHLLGNSDAATLLAAADAFLLNSFFEGWPLATTEAVAAGLPVIVSDTGGAVELVARAVDSSVLIGNASGPATSVSDRAARAARRQATRQRNGAELRAAVMAVAAACSSGAASGPSGLSPDDSYDEMVHGHARVIRAARQGTASSPGQRFDPRRLS